MMLSHFSALELNLGDGSNVDRRLIKTRISFFVAKEGEENWVVFKTPNAGNTQNI